MKTGKKVLGAVLAAAMALSSITPVFAADKVKITMTEEREVEKIYTIPDKQEVPFVQDGKKLEFTLKEIKGHQMTAVCYKN